MSHLGGVGIGVPDVQGVADRLAIADVLHAYADAVDRHDWPGAAAMFTQDALLDYTASGGPVGSRTEVVDWIRESLAPLGRIQHSLTNLRVEVAGDRARATCLLLNPIQLGTGPEAGPGLLVGGHYDDHLRRTAEGWRIEARLQATLWTAELVVRATPPGA